jgi:hypothetical protein
MRPAFNLKRKYVYTIMTAEDWTKGTGNPLAVKGLAWVTDGSRMKEGTGVGIYGQSVGRRLNFSLRSYATVIQPEIYAILACAHKIRFQGRPEKQ